VQEYVGGYSDWRRHADKQAAARTAEAAARAPDKSSASGARDATRAKPNAAKLSFREQRELADAPAKIEALEREQEELADRVSDPAFYRSDPNSQKRVHARVAALAEEIAAAYRRWEELEGRKG
jgi:ATP-binding cassette subfamily F protein uup